MVVLFNVMNIFLPMNCVLLSVRVMASASSVILIAANRVSVMCLTETQTPIIIYETKSVLGLEIRRQLNSHAHPKCTA